MGARRIIVGLAVSVMSCVQVGLAADGEPAAGQWRTLGPSGVAPCGAAVYSPTRKQILRWGEYGENRNAVHAFDAEKLQWSRDHEPDKAQLGGNFYGGQSSAGWVGGTNRPGPFFLFRQACWDSTRNRMVIVALNVTAAYDPAERTWTRINAAFENAKGERQEAAGPKHYDGPWFSPVPGQWGSCAYDPANDEILLFPLWACRATEWSRSGVRRIGPDRLNDAGVLAGHYGTFIFDCKSNTWRLPELGGKEMLAARQRLAELIGEQREACRAAWKALIVLRGEKNDEAAKLMAPAAEAEKALVAKLVAEKATLEKLAGELKGFESGQVKDAAGNLAATIARAEKAAAGLAASRPDELPALCSQLQAVYRELRLIRDEDIYVQPIPRCSTSVVYDAKNQCMVMAGGTHLDRALNDTWVYDCKTRRWQRRSPVPEALEWPGMCYDSKRGVTLYAANKGTYAYDAAKDQWTNVGAGIPKYNAWNFYCNMEYDPAKDLAVLNVGGRGSGELTHVMRPLDGGAPAKTEPAARERVDETPFPPPADPAALEQIRSLPVNAWTPAKPGYEPTHRSWSRIEWDPTLRCVIYQGGGHAGTTNNTISAYFPESNKWVDAFRPQFPPSIFGSWCCAEFMPAFERGMGLHAHAREYRSFDGRMVYAQSSGFEWCTRDIPTPTAPRGGPLVDVARRRLIGGGQGNLQLTDADTGKVETRKLGGGEQSQRGGCVIAGRNQLIAYGYDKKTQTGTVLGLDLDKLDEWKKLHSSNTAPAPGGEQGGQFMDIAGTDYLAYAPAGGNKEVWIYSFQRNAWKVLPVAEQGKVPFDVYAQIVWDPHHKVFIHASMVRGNMWQSQTLLLRPDFDAIRWE